MSGVLESGLLNWEAIGSMNEQGEQVDPLESRKTKITELDSLVEPGTDVIIQYQRTVSFRGKLRSSASLH